MHNILISSELKSENLTEAFSESEFAPDFCDFKYELGNKLENNYSAVVFSDDEFLKIIDYCNCHDKLKIVVSTNDNSVELYKKGANLVLNEDTDYQIIVSFLKNQFSIHDFSFKLNRCISELNSIVQGADNLAKTLDIIINKLKDCLNIKDVNIQLYNPLEKFWFYTYNQDGNNIIEKINNPDKLKEEIIVKNESVLLSKTDLQNKNYENKDDNLKHLILVPLNFFKEMFGVLELKFYSGDVNPNMVFNNLLKAQENISLIINKNYINLKIKESEEKVKEIEKFKTSFLSNLSHEVRTPMNSILGFSSLLSDDFLSEEEKAEYIQLIHDNGNSLMELISDMVDFAKIESGEISINKIEFKLYNLINQSVKNAKHNSNDVQANIIIDEKLKNDDIFLITDPYRFEQSLTKIIANAIKFGEGNDIEISYLITSDKKLRLSIEDHGIGMDSSDKSKIFDSFSKISTGDIESYGGTGLGLSIVKGIMDILDVEIEVETEKDIGSKFILIINEKDYIKTNKQNKFGNYFWKDKTILIAEDNLSNYQYLNAILKKSKANIIWEKDGYKALNRFKREEKVDLILMDILMPGMSGIESTKEIRKLNTQVPIIAQTAYKGSVNEKEAIQAGCNYFFTKPINAKELLKKIDGLFG